MQPYASNINYQQQINNATNAYNADKAATQQDQGNLSAYTNSMPSADQLYGQDLTNAQSMYGFNPKDLAAANQNLAYSQDQLAQAPQAAQQQGNYYGTTAGAEANNYSNLAGNLNSTIADQTNAVNAYQNLLAATQTQANQQATLGLNSEQLKSQNLQNIIANALGISNQDLSQQGNYITQQGNYGQYKVGEAQAAAQAAAAAAQQTAANASMLTANQQVTQYNNIMNAMKSLYGNQWQTALGELEGGQKISVPVYGGGGGLQVGISNGGMQGSGISLQ